jgi:membrane protein
MAVERRLGPWAVVRETVGQWMAGAAPTQSAALAFYTLFSLGPVLVVAVTIAGAVFGEEATRAEIGRQVMLLAGSAAAEAVRQVLETAAEPELRGWSGLVGVVTLLVGASAVFGQLQEALNAVWEVKPRPGHLIHDFLRKRLLSFGLVLAVGFVLLVSLVLSAALSAFGGYVQRRLAIAAELLAVIDFVTFFLLVTFLFGLIFKLLPDAEIAWRDVAVGATATALVFSIGKELIGIYRGRSEVASVYGVAGSLVLLLLWSYSSSMILLLGAGFTRVWSRRHRPRGVVPEPGAARAPG